MKLCFKNGDKFFNSFLETGTLTITLWLNVYQQISLVELKEIFNKQIRNNFRIINSFILTRKSNTYSLIFRKSCKSWGKTLQYNCRILTQVNVSPCQGNTSLLSSLEIIIYHKN